MQHTRILIASALLGASGCAVEELDQARLASISNGPVDEADCALSPDLDDPGAAPRAEPTDSVKVCLMIPTGPDQPSCLSPAGAALSRDAPRCGAQLYLLAKRGGCGADEDKKVALVGGQAVELAKQIDGKPVTLFGARTTLWQAAYKTRCVVAATLATIATAEHVEADMLALDAAEARMLSLSATADRCQILARSTDKVPTSTAVTVLDSSKEYLGALSIFDPVGAPKPAFLALALFERDSPGVGQTVTYEDAGYSWGGTEWKSTHTLVVADQRDAYRAGAMAAP